MNEKYFIYRDGQKIELTELEVTDIYRKRQREYYYEDVVENMEYIVTEMLDIDKEITNNLGKDFCQKVLEEYYDIRTQEDGWFDILVTVINRKLREMNLI